MKILPININNAIFNNRGQFSAMSGKINRILSPVLFYVNHSMVNSQGFYPRISDQYLTIEWEDVIIGYPS